MRQLYSPGDRQGDEFAPETGVLLDYIWTTVPLFAQPCRVAQPPGSTLSLASIKRYGSWCSGANCSPIVQTGFKSGACNRLDLEFAWAAA